MDIESIVLEEENNLKDIFKQIDEICYKNSLKVLNAFKKENITEADFASSTGYGYSDGGRDKIERVYSDIFNSEDALVRVQFISGTHALSTTLFGLLRPNDLLLSISGRPYDTLHEVIGIKECSSSLKSFGIKYDEIDLKDNDFDINKIISYLKSNKVKVIEIQRSRGYSNRDSLAFEKIESVIKEIRKVDKNVIIMIDNCYCEFVEDKSIIDAGADIAVGSLIKNLGGGITSNGGYVVGKKDLIKLVADRLNVPGQDKEVGPSLGFNKSILMGLYLAPSVVKNSLKVSVLASKVLERLGYEVHPKYNEKRADIVLSIVFNDKNKLIDFTRGIQEYSAIDSNAVLEPSDMPGYDNKIIMASGSFTQGSSIELSCDGPIREPYIAYMQGSLTYEYGKLALINAIKKVY